MIDAKLNFLMGFLGLNNFKFKSFLWMATPTRPITSKGAESKILPVFDRNARTANMQAIKRLVAGVMYLSEMELLFR